jgi:small subunit ribosomal protein S7
MPRRKLTQKRELIPDHKYDNILIGRLINKIMLNGKKTVAERIVYDALQIAAKKVGKDPIQVLDEAINNIAPAVQLKSRRIGGSNMQIPSEISLERKTALALQWLIKASRGKKGKPMAECLGQELIDAFNNAGEAVKKKEETHRMAEANRAFAHYARF